MWLKHSIPTSILMLWTKLNKSLCIVNIAMSIYDIVVAVLCLFDCKILLVVLMYMVMLQVEIYFSLSSHRKGCTCSQNPWLPLALWFHQLWHLQAAESTVRWASTTSDHLVSVCTWNDPCLVVRISILAGKMPFKVVVVGAGVSGLMSARQLQSFGLEVTVVEARVSCCSFKTLGACLSLVVMCIVPLRIGLAVGFTHSVREPIQPILGLWWSQD